MGEKRILIVLGIVNIIVLGVLGGLYIKRDTTPPVITIEKDGFVYAETMDEAELLAGVSAADPEDGDVSSSLVVEKVIPNAEKHTALVTYGARDSKGNMCKATCKVAMEGKPEAGEEKPESLSTMLPVAGEAGNSTNGVPEEMLPVEAEDEEAATEENEADAPAEVGSTNRETNPPARETANTPAEGTQAANPPRETPPVGNPPAENPPAETPPAPQKPAAGEAPSLRFGKTEVTTVRGQDPAWVNFIGELKDNKDNYEYLLNHLKIDGTYDRNKEGTYSVKVSTIDSDGNESKASTVTITVQ